LNATTETSTSAPDLSSIPTATLAGKLVSKYLAYSRLNSSNNDIEERYTSRLNHVF